MTKISEIESQIEASPQRWLITGVAGFIGSNLLERLLELGQVVIGFDNLSTGHMRNLEDVRRTVGDRKWGRFTFLKRDIREINDCRRACEGIDYVLHQAAIGSVPRSIVDPVATNQSNIDGFLNMLIASRDSGVKRFVYAASSSSYGDSPELPKKEDKIGLPLSPYAVTKYVNELYAHVFSLNYGLQTIGLRYFNVYGKRQDPNGDYAAVIPRWIDALLESRQPVIFGDGETSRDFCYIEDVIQANLLAATADNPEGINKVYNVAFGDSTTLKELFDLIKDCIATELPEVKNITPDYADFRKGDVRHSLADISRAKELLGFVPRYSIDIGMRDSIGWFTRNLGNGSR